MPPRAAACRRAAERHAPSRRGWHRLASLCEWKRLQANPDQDVVVGGTFDGQPKIDLSDAQFLQLATVRSYRFVDDVNVTCEGACSTASNLST